MTVKVTKEVFMKYYDVQMGGAYNMLDPRARELTGLDKETYLDIIKNYSKYYSKFFK